jgi:hypothetical protein
MRQKVNYTGNVTAAEYTNSLDSNYVMCCKEIKGYKPHFAMKKCLERDSLELIEETVLNLVDTLEYDLVTSVNAERTSCTSNFF